MDKKLLLIGGLGAVLVLALGILVGQALGSFWYAPQNAPLPTLNPADIATPLPPTQPPAGENTSPTPTYAVTPPTPTPVPSPTPSPEPLCGGPATMDVLVVGSYRGYYDLADAIRIAHIDFTKPEVVVLTLPRDLLVNLPEGDPYPSPITMNQGYFLGTPIMRGGVGPTGGAELLARVIALNFGVQVEHYVIVSGRGVEKFIDAIGGVPVYIPQDIDDDATKLRLKAGNHVVDGTQFLRLLRYRGNQGDLFRIKHQNEILKSLLKRLFSPEILKSWDDFIRLYSDVVMTDLSPAQITQLACLGRHLSLEDIQFRSPPEEFFELDVRPIYGVPQGHSVLLWDDRFVQWLQEPLRAAP